MKPFDITCTATLRPELLKITLDSHIENLFKENIKKANFIINIDVTGYKILDPKEKVREKTKRIQEVMNLVYSYPFLDTTIRIGDPPFFPTAFMSCMSKLRYDLFFHLEEDWELLQSINFEEMTNLFNKHDDLAHLRLSAFKSTEDKCKNWNKFLHWNGEFFEVTEEDKLSIAWAGHPSLNRSIFMQQCLIYMNPDLNPEKQIKGRRYPHQMNSILKRYRFGSYHAINSNPIIKDIGREWMIRNGFKKKGDKAFFTNWEEG